MITRGPIPYLAAGLLASALPAALQAQQAIRVGQSVTGSLQQGDAVASDDSYYDEYVIQATAGQRLVITMTSADFDTYLAFGRGGGNAFEAEATDDDGGGGTNSRIEVTVSGAGRYTIRANSLSGGETGSYSLSVQGSGGGPVGGVPTPVSRPTPSGGVQQIASGQPVRGRLDTSDPKLDDDSHYDLFVYRGRPGEQIVVTMRSSDFDTYLAGGALSGGTLSASETDDDGAGGTDSRIEARVGSDGTYGIRANSLSADQTGAYTLTVTSSAAPAPRPGAANGSAVAVGQSVSGTLSSGDRKLGDDSYYDQYTVRGDPGESVMITLSSSAFDAYLRGGPGNGGDFEEYDDDGGGSTNARLQVTLDRSGVYTVQANSYAANQTGAYTLMVESGGGGRPSPASGSATIALGQTINGRLESSDATLPDNSHFDPYVFQGTPGQQVLVTMRSTDFDTYLKWARMNGGQIEEGGSDDDSGGGTNSQLVATVPSNGNLIIVANSLAAGQTGSYTITVAAAGGSGAPSAPRNIPAGAATVAAGQSVNGALARTDGMLADSSYFDQYVYQGNPGDRLRITLQSSAFDAFLLWGRLDGETYTEEGRDDDSGGNSNAQLEVTVNSTGTYVIRANSFDKQQTGSYTLRVERLGAGATTTPSRPGGPARPGGSTSTSGGAGTKWQWAYVNATTPTFRNLEQRIKQNQMLETFANQLTSEFPLPDGASGVNLRVAQCGQVNAFYSPRDKQVTFCYELLHHLAQMYVADNQWTTEQRDAVQGAFRFIMMHEVGHALVDVMELPITGREEDAVDQLATLMLIRAGGEKGAQEAYHGVLSIQPGRNATFGESDFADEQSLGPQRLYNVMCWIYGSDPQKFSNLVTQGHLPRERAARCQGEYEQLSKSWMRLLGR